MNRIKSILACVITALLCSPPRVFAFGGNSDGGGGPDTVSAGALRLLIEGEGLKQAMRNYVATVQLDKIEDAAVRETLSRMMHGQSLLMDINTPQSYYVARPEQPCVDAFNNSVPASTQIGKVGARVCFDVPKLVDAYKGYSEEEVMIHLASLAFHEHVHHFQTPTRDLNQIQRNEDEANRVAGYVLVTAKFVQIPVLEWAPNAKLDQFSEIRRLFNQIQAKERVFLSVKAADYADYPDYIGKPDRGLFRLLPRETYDGKLSINGGGAYYSFTQKSHDYQTGAEIGWQQQNLATGFAGCDFGFFTDLGTVPLEQVSLSMPELSFLIQFTPFNSNEPKIRMQQAATSRGFSKNGYRYSGRIDGVAVGRTYALRAINFGRSDQLVAIKIVRVFEDGSLIVAWRRLKAFPVSSCGHPPVPVPDISGGEAN